MIESSTSKNIQKNGNIFTNFFQAIRDMSAYFSGKEAKEIIIHILGILLLILITILLKIPFEFVITMIYSFLEFLGANLSGLAPKTFEIIMNIIYIIIAIIYFMRTFTKRYKGINQKG